MEFRTCSKCGVLRGEDEFYAPPNHYTCKPCRRAYLASRKASRPEVDRRRAEAVTSRCSLCGERKPVEAFSRNCLAHDGCHSYCKPCVSQAGNGGSCPICSRPAPADRECKGCARAIRRLGGREGLEAALESLDWSNRG